MELIEQLIKSNINIPVLVITGFKSKALVLQLMQIGCYDFIEKPFEPEEVLRRVEEAIKKPSIDEK